MLVVLRSSEEAALQGRPYQPAVFPSPSAAYPMHAPVAMLHNPAVPDVQGPMPDKFATVIKRSWMMPGPVKASEPSPVEVASLVQQSLTWSDHDRAQACVRICHKHPLLWQEFLLQEKEEQQRKARRHKRLREALDSEISHDEFINQQKKTNQRSGDHSVASL